MFKSKDVIKVFSSFGKEKNIRKNNHITKRNSCHINLVRNAALSAGLRPNEVIASLRTIN